MRCGFVTIIGRPNVGKSTLLNRLVGQKVSIVGPKPQTTRNRILAIANKPSTQIVFFDTPGIHKPKRQIDRLMMDAVTKSLKSVDLGLLIIDVQKTFGREDEQAIEILGKAQLPVVLGINKIDARKKIEILPLIELYRKKYSFVEIVPFSALTGEIVLENQIPEGKKPLYSEDTITVLPERFFVAEIVREKILRFTNDEVPHSAAVRVDRWEDADDLTRIEMSIFVERASQKAILIGRGGKMLKDIGTASRLDIEQLLGRKLYLGLHVSVKSEWRDNMRLLRELGV